MAFCAHEADMEVKGLLAVRRIWSGSKEILNFNYLIALNKTNCECDFFDTLPGAPGNATARQRGSKAAGPTGASGVPAELGPLPRMEYLPNTSRTCLEGGPSHLSLKAPHGTVYVHMRRNEIEGRLGVRRT